MVGLKMYKYPFLHPQYPTEESFYVDLKKILETGPQTNNGPWSYIFENKLESLLKTNVAVVDHGESALILAIASLGLLNKNKPIIVPSYTFPGTVSAIYWTGNYPVYCDVCSVSYPLIDTQKVEELLDHIQPAAIIGVDLYGMSCDYSNLNKISNNYSTPIIIDSAQAFGTQKDSRFIGNNCYIHCFSFHTTKTLPTLEGGMVSSSDPFIIDKIRSMRDFGKNSKGDYTEIGINCKLNEVQALIGVYGLDNFNFSLYKRELFNYYVRSLQKINVATLKVPKNISPMMNFFPIFSKYREQLKEYLLEKSIETKPYWDTPVHLLPSFKHKKNFYLDLSITDKVSDKALALPFYNSMTEIDIDYIVRKIYDFKN